MHRLVHLFVYRVWREEVVRPSPREEEHLHSQSKTPEGGGCGNRVAPMQLLEGGCCALSARREATLRARGAAAYIEHDDGGQVEQQGVPHGAGGEGRRKMGRVAAASRHGSDYSGAGRGGSMSRLWAPYRLMIDNKIKREREGRVGE